MTEQTTCTRTEDTKKSAHESDFLAVHTVGAVGFWGRGNTERKAIETCVRTIASDWPDYWVRPTKLKIAVFNVWPYDELTIDGGGVRPANQPRKYLEMMRFEECEIPKRRRS